MDKHNGRPGMSLWAIFVCGVIRLDLNIDYDRCMNSAINARARCLRGGSDSFVVETDVHQRATHTDRLGRVQQRSPGVSLDLPIVSKEKLWHPQILSEPPIIECRTYIYQVQLTFFGALALNAVDRIDCSNQAVIRIQTNYV